MERHFASNRAEHDFLRKEILNCVGRLQPIRKKEVSENYELHNLTRLTAIQLHREHMALRKRVRDGTLPGPASPTMAHKSTSTTSVSLAEASTSVADFSVDEPNAAYGST